MPDEGGAQRSFAGDLRAGFNRVGVDSQPGSVSKGQRARGCSLKNLEAAQDARWVACLSLGVRCSPC